MVVLDEEVWMLVIVQYIVRVLGMMNIRIDDMLYILFMFYYWFLCMNVKEEVGQELLSLKSLDVEYFFFGSNLLRIWSYICVRVNNLVLDEVQNVIM